jgi:hypothetical protein
MLTGGRRITSDERDRDRRGSQWPSYDMITMIRTAPLEVSTIDVLCRSAIVESFIRPGGSIDVQGSPGRRTTYAASYAIEKVKTVGTDKIPGHGRHPIHASSALRRAMTPVCLDANAWCVAGLNIFEGRSDGHWNPN